MNKGKKAHNQYAIAGLAEKMGYDSVGELESVFLGKCEPYLPFTDYFCSTFGLNRNWLLEGKDTPYKNNEFSHVYPDEYLTEILESKPETIYFILCPSEYIEFFLVLKFSELKYKIFQRTWHLGGDVGATGQGQIVGLRKLIADLYRNGFDCKRSGRILVEEVFRELFNGNVFPGSVIDSTKENYWWEDFTDIYHRRPRAMDYEALYGKGFVDAQSIVQWYLERHED